MKEKDFWLRVDKQFDGCWIWTGSIATARGGYGIVGFQGKTWRAHRLAWTLANNQIPKGLYVLHSCDNPPCVNPAHLRTGTQADNMKDAHQRGRFPHMGQPPGERHAMAKLTDVQVIEMHHRLTNGALQSTLALDYNVCLGTIALIARGRTWRHLNLAPLPLRKGAKRPGAKLTEEKVRQIRKRATQGEALQSIANFFGVGRTTIHSIVNRTKWRHVQ